MSKNTNAFIVSLMLYKIKSALNFSTVFHLAVAVAFISALGLAGKTVAVTCSDITDPAARRACQQDQNLSGPQDPCAGLSDASLRACRQDQNLQGGTGSSSTETNTQNLSQPTFVKNDCNPQGADATITEENCGIIRYLVIFINVLSAIVGVVIVMMIIIGGIQYASSGDDPQAISGAKRKIFNAVLALVIYIFSYAFLQWIVPGGVLP